MDDFVELAAPVRDAVMGDNSASADPVALLREDLESRSRDLRARQAELLDAVSRAPARITDEPTCGRVADFVKQITACAKALEGQRVDQKEPHLVAGRTVDGFYKALTDPLDRSKREIESRITLYQRDKADAERRRREEEARRQREEAERARKAAAEAELAARDDRGLNDAIAADAAARQASADAAVAAKAADAKAADLSRSRGDYGAVASLRTFWDFRAVDRDTLDLEALRQHLPADALDKAVRAFVKAGGRKLAGVEIFENTATSVR